MPRRLPGASPTRGVVALVGISLLVACTAGSNAPDAPEAESTDATTTSVAATTARPTPAPAPAALPDNCGALLPVTELDAALGTGLPGSVSYVRGEPIAGIGRTDRITCGYGIVIGEDASPLPPLLEISVASYTDDAAAADRIGVTTVDRQSAGDRVEDTEVEGLPAVLLTGVTGATLVFADGPWTYSLTLLTAVLPPEQVPSALAGVATAVLTQAMAGPTG